MSITVRANLWCGVAFLPPVHRWHSVCTLCFEAVSVCCVMVATHTDHPLCGHSWVPVAHHTMPHTTHYTHTTLLHQHGCVRRCAATVWHHSDVTVCATTQPIAVSQLWWCHHHNCMPHNYCVCHYSPRYADLCITAFVCLTVSCTSGPCVTTGSHMCVTSCNSVLLCCTHNNTNTNTNDDDDDNHNTGWVTPVCPTIHPQCPQHPHTVATTMWPCRRHELGHCTALCVWCLLVGPTRSADV